ncbi:hypothetical protein C8J56DRAFT_775671, partial [Mycena floridula]
NARVWKVYLDESESYDEDMLRSFRDTIDALLVFAALFSGVVTTLLVQTSQALQPDYALLTTLLLTEQNKLLRAAGNASAINGVSLSPTSEQLGAGTNTDIWINALFIASLSLSLATALLSVLVKQWLQVCYFNMPHQFIAHTSPNVGLCICHPRWQCYGASSHQTISHYRP